MSTYDINTLLKTVLEATGESLTVKISHDSDRIIILLPEQDLEPLWKDIGYGTVYINDERYTYSRGLEMADDDTYYEVMSLWKENSFNDFNKENTVYTLDKSTVDDIEDFIDILKL